METLYADYAVSVNYHGGMIRVVLGNQTVAEDGKIASEIDPHTVLIMPTRSFLNFYESSMKLLEKLAEAEVVEKKETNEQ